MEYPVHVFCGVFVAISIAVLGVVTDSIDVLPTSYFCFFASYELPAEIANCTVTASEDCMRTMEERQFCPTLSRYRASMLFGRLDHTRVCLYGGLDTSGQLTTAPNNAGFEFVTDPATAQ